jgi:acyl carrier protein
MQPSDADTKLVLDELRKLQARRSATTSFDETTRLSAIGFRSIDFAELALEIEDKQGRELDFEQGDLGRIETVGDVVGFFVGVLRSG